jgi:hypothetical protein
VKFQIELAKIDQTLHEERYQMVDLLMDLYHLQTIVSNQNGNNNNGIILSSLKNLFQEILDETIRYSKKSMIS